MKRSSTRIYSLSEGWHVYLYTTKIYNQPNVFTWTLAQTIISDELKPLNQIILIFLLASDNGQGELSLRNNVYNIEIDTLPSGFAYCEKKKKTWTLYRKASTLHNALIAFYTYVKPEGMLSNKA